MDGLRGFAAMIVVMYHFSDLFKPFHLDEGYLVVDLFFVMSGFVIASAYEGKLASGSIGARHFLKLRLIRLYPLYFLGTLTGSVGVLLRLPHAHWHLAASAFSMALLMLPCPNGVTPPDGTLAWFLYPLNYPSWSLLFELLANVAYAVCFRFLSVRVLASAVLISALALTLKVVHAGSINSGWALASSHLGIVRVAYGFFLGVLLFRLHAGRRHTSNPIAIGVAAWFPLMFLVPVAAALHVAFTLSIVLIFIPGLVWIGASFEPSKRVREVFLFFGTVSYGIYMLHVPVIGLLRLATGIGPQPSLAQSLAVDSCILLIVVVVAALGEQFYDRPIRHLLMRGVRGRQPQTAIGAAPLN
nr:acyltransferase [Burkholderia sp. Ax-1719]